MGSLFLLSIGVIILLIVSFLNSRKLRERISGLEKQLSQLNKINERLQNLENKLQKDVTKKEEPVSEPIKVKHAVDITLTGQAPTAPVQTVKQTVNEPVVPKSRTREEWESFIGGKLLNRIGALALIIGLGFFLKHAFDNNWISETVRVIIGALAGLFCLGLAYRSHKKGYLIFAQGLLGAGISILYLSVYASFNFYALVPQWIAFILMSVVTALSLAVGLYYSSLAVGILGWAGGFLTPILLSTGVPNETGLFTYIALLDVGLLAIVLAKKEWSIIEPLTFAGTWILFFAWYFDFYKNSDLTITVFFITLFWALFFGLDFARLRLKEKTNTVQHITAGMNLLCFFIMLYVLIDQDYHSWMGSITLLLACIYFISCLLHHEHTAAGQTAAIRFTLSAIALAVIATSIQFEDFITIIFWSIEIALLVWCGASWKKRFIYLSAAVLFIFTVLKFLYTEGAFSYYPVEQFTLLFNERCLALAVMVIAFGLSAWLLKDSEEKGRIFSAVLHSSWCAALFTLITVETIDFFDLKLSNEAASGHQYIQYLRMLFLAVIWCLISIPLICISIKNKNMPVMISGFIILFLCVYMGIICGMGFIPITDYTLLFNIRTLSILLIIAGLFAHYRLVKFNRNEAVYIPKILNALQVGIVVLIFVLLTGETMDYFKKQIAEEGITGDELRHINNLTQLILSGIWLVYSFALMAFGFWRSLRIFRIFAFVLFGFTILKIFIYDLSYLETLYRIYSFAGLGIILLTVSYIYQRYKGKIFGNDAGTIN
ncbi:MAG: DUF2339 domain-containing protein [Bacteroidetes bacterium]|nr:DUF2339 domain-containing protein [Bacteroidota bacterium]